MKFANPAPLGLFGFATTTWLLSMLNAGWFPIVKDLPLMMATAFAFALYIEALPRGELAFQGAFLLVWGVLTALLFIATLKLNKVLQWIFGTLIVAFVLLGLSHLLPEPIGGTLHTVGGYVGMVTALLAAYQAAAEVVNEVHGKTVMPI